MSDAWLWYNAGTVQLNVKTWQLISWIRIPIINDTRKICNLNHDLINAHFKQLFFVTLAQF